MLETLKIVLPFRRELNFQKVASLAVGHSNKLKLLNTLKRDNALRRCNTLKRYNRLKRYNTLK